MYATTYSLAGRIFLVVGTSLFVGCAIWNIVSPRNQGEDSNRAHPDHEDDERALARRRFLDEQAKIRNPYPLRLFPPPSW